MHSLETVVPMLFYFHCVWAHTLTLAVQGDFSKPSTHKMKNKPHLDWPTSSWNQPTRSTEYYRTVYHTDDLEWMLLPPACRAPEPEGLRYRAGEFVDPTRARCPRWVRHLAWSAASVQKPQCDTVQFCILYYE